jgi:YfiH family protein
MPVSRRTYPIATGTTVVVVATGKRDGDLRVDGPAAELGRRRRALADRPWAWLRQVHGAEVVRAVPGDLPEGVEADAVVGDLDEVVLAVHTADCAPVALVGRRTGVIGAVHAGWRGLVAGVVERAVAEVRAGGEDDVVAFVGPCIDAAHYEFGVDDLDLVAARYGDGVRSATADGRPALDLRAGVRAALEATGVRSIEVSPMCTASASDELFSHRARSERGRQGLLVWREPQAVT